MVSSDLSNAHSNRTKPEISVVINTLNEEKNIAACIASVKEIASEILVCDMNSDDHTVEIARSEGARIMYHLRTGFVEPARVSAIAEARSEWVLVIDADERMTNKLADQLLALAGQEDVDVVEFGKLYNYFGHYPKHGGFYLTDYPGFFRKNVYLSTVTENEGMIHQSFRNLQKSAKNIVRLDPEVFMLHEAYPTIEKYAIKTIGMYSAIEARERLSRGEQFSMWVLLLQPLVRFVKIYIFRQGYRDGLAGFILAVLFCCHLFTMRATMWFLEEQQNGSSEDR
jgi:glycosyltransferase involved in cell wall biosynthesis